ncbi:MAG: hypothetical protein KJ970_03020 [Candidatus Eisenbacteria bacterium]|uniref:Uncharacterized protein n=1 Tax=Eiseniibacteriota bacterium TaxID=2212470 RepID=A0A948W2F1_UNCEI|nr:hypothetical protein [Candidatus Eisenbacteria bacterium]MBU1948272.1 hypothetical protein [Candidatus Eisenbacteria bacterium]MBU2689872.1 hypothetical protein [Candidatus Eisenbacteria bacterium]
MSVDNRGFLKLLTLGCWVLLLSGGPIRPAGALCLGDEPQIILDCLSRAHGELDIEFYKQLLAEDFHYLHATGGADWDYARELAAVEGTFEAYSKGSITMTIQDGFDIVEGSKSGDYWIENLTVRLEFDIDGPGGEEPFFATKRGLQMGVRLIQSPEPHLVIFECREPEGATSFSR